MKKQFILGIMIAGSVFAVNASAQQKAAGAKPYHEVFRDFTTEVKKVAYGGKTTAKDLSAQQSAKATDVLMNELKLSNAEKNTCKAVFGKASKADQVKIVDSLATILAAKNMTKDRNDAESVSIRNAADAALKLVSNAPLISARTSSKFLNEAEYKETSDALRTLLTTPDKFIAFGTKERDSFTRTITKADELSIKTETYEEAFVKAIMENQGLTKDKALEVVRKLKELC